MGGSVAHRTPYLTLGGAALVLTAIVGGHTIFAGPGHSSPGPADIRASTAGSASPAPTYPPATKSAAPETVHQKAPSVASEARAFPAEATYAGRNLSGRIAVAVVVSGERAVAYLCDGRRIEAWLTGSAVGGELDLRGKRGARLVGRLVADRLVGEFRVAGDDYRYRIEPAGKPAGLYRAESGSSILGWIRLPNGDVVGLRSGPSGSAPAPRLTQGGSVRVDQQTVPISEVSGRDEL